MPWGLCTDKERMLVARGLVVQDENGNYVLEKRYLISLLLVLLCPFLLKVKLLLEALGQ